MAPQRSGRAARPDPVFDELVDESDYFSLPLLCQACHVDAGYQPTVSHMRRLLHDANNGTSEHIAALDKEEFRRLCAERRAERDAERAARAESLAAERRDDEARLARRGGPNLMSRHRILERGYNRIMERLHRIRDWAG